MNYAQPMLTNDLNQFSFICEPFAIKMAPLKEIGLDALQEVGSYLEGYDIINLHKVNRVCRMAFTLPSLIAQSETFNVIKRQFVSRARAVLSVLSSHYDATVLVSTCVTDYPQSFYNLKNAIANLLAATENDTPTPPRILRRQQFVVYTGNVARSLVF